MRGGQDGVPLGVGESSMRRASCFAHFVFLSQVCVHAVSSGNFAPLSSITDIDIITIKKEREGSALGQWTLLVMPLMREFSPTCKSPPPCTVARRGLGRVVSAHLYHHVGPAASWKGRGGEQLLS